MEINRKDIELLAKNSDLSKSESEYLFNSHVRPNQEAWNSFLRYTLLIMGLGFLASGIIFFFAYNWENLSKWTKLLIPLFLIIMAVACSMYYKSNKLVYSLLLSFASIMVGAFLAVFGQIYQTGAYAYELFFTWILLILIWCIVLDFEGSWMLFIILVHSAISLYINYYQTHLVGIKELLIQSLCAVLYNIIFYQRSHYYGRNYYSWFCYLIFMAMMGFITITISVLFFHEEKVYFIPSLIISALIYYFYYLQSIERKILFYQAIMLLSIIIIVSSFILSFDEVSSFQVFIVFVINAVSITMGIKYLRNLQNLWNE